MNVRLEVDELFGRAMARNWTIKRSLKLHREMQPPPVVFGQPDTAVNELRVVRLVQPDWGLKFVIMDAVHYVRCALDQIAWRLVELGGGTPGLHTGFPISKDEPTFQKDVDRKLAGAGRAYVDRVRELRAYRGGDNRFWDLAELDNAYKHKLVIPATMLLPEVVLNFGFDRDADGNILWLRPQTNEMVALTPSTAIRLPRDETRAPMMVITPRVGLSLPSGRTIEIDAIHRAVEEIPVLVSDLTAVLWEDLFGPAPDAAIFVIYRDLDAFAEAFVVQRFLLDKPAETVSVTGNLEHARAAIPSDAVLMPVSGEDDPTILETWMASNRR